MTKKITRIWHVSPQRLCNFSCSYCVSIGEYAKSNERDWAQPEDEERFRRTVDWLGTREYEIGVRLATLGEPFASRAFLDRAAWLTTCSNVAFVELVTNGSLLPTRLARIACQARTDKISLWITHHPNQIEPERLVEHARIARDQYGCFVVLNALLFPDNACSVRRLRTLATETKLRFNLDLGYDPLVPFGVRNSHDTAVPLTRTENWLDEAVSCGGDPEILSKKALLFNSLDGIKCAAGSDYFYIGLHGDVYSCSRYQVLGFGRLGNIHDPGFDLPVVSRHWAPCQACYGCCNKEDYLNVASLEGMRRETTPSLGWVGA